MDTFFVCSASPPQVHPVNFQDWAQHSSTADSTQIVCLIPPLPLQQTKPPASERVNIPNRSLLNHLSPQPLQLAVVVLLVLALSLLIYQTLHSTQLRPDAEAMPIRPLDLNLASQDELRHLPNIGPKLSQRIDDYRRQNGRFRKVDDLRKVHGIGPTILAGLRSRVYVTDDDDVEASDISEKVESKEPRRTKAKPKAEVDAPNAKPQSKWIDINRADAAELQALKVGIGPKKSQDIIDYRNEKGPFRSIDDLRRVPGIGPKTLEKLRPYLTLEAEPEPISIQR